MDMTVRPANPEDLSFLRDMLWEATAVSASMRALGKDTALDQPSIRKYLDGWGRHGDAAVVAVDGRGQRLGVAWYRLFPSDAGSYGFVAADIPELSIGVAPDLRGQGVGTALLLALMAAARADGYTHLSLSVDRQNPARALYERLGFRDSQVSASEDSSITLITTL
jgi:ribosomal protein S18 acetylase RimI-like enzyme